MLEYVVYPEGGATVVVHQKHGDIPLNVPWRSHQVENPTWAQIDDAIRQMDQFGRPLLYLWPTPDEAQHICDGRTERFEVVGGNGIYWFALYLDGAEGYFLNPDGSDNEVEVWTSDQGFACEDKHVCRDVVVVLRAARYYAENRGYDPSVTWRKRSA
jgi:hypothetical protein